MAFPTSPTTESAGKVRQKAYAATYGTSTSTVPVSPFDFYAVKAFFLHLAANKGNPDLRYVNIDGLAAASDGGASANIVAVDGPCTLYVVYLRKTGATETIVKVANSATTFTADGTQDQAFPLTVAGTEFVVYPDGRAYSTGITYTEQTTRTGTTQTLKANRVDGFIIVSA